MIQCRRASTMPEDPLNCLEMQLLNYMRLPELVSGEVHAVEVAEHITTLYILSNKTEFAERPETNFTHQHLHKMRNNVVNTSQIY